MQYFHVILDSFKFVRQDFTGFDFNLLGFSYKIVQFFEVFGLMFVMYALGRIMLRRYFKSLAKSNYSFYLSLSLGYIFLGSLIFLMGFTGFMYGWLIVLLIIILGFFILFDLKKHNIKIRISKNYLRFDFKKYLLVFFIFIAFLRLIPPQSAGDPLDYHLRFPKIYLHEHSMMIPALGDESYTIVPQLPEMLFVVSQIFTNGEASRIIHFAFFCVLCVFLYRIGITNKKSNENTYVSLLFASSPIILELGYQAFSDLPAILCFLLCVRIVLTEKKDHRNIILMGILFGGILASKLWLLLYSPFFLLFISLNLEKNSLKNIFKSISFFVIPSILVVSLWYIRGIMLKGNPFYVNTDQGRVDADYSLLSLMIKYLTPSGFLDRFSLPTDYGPIYLLGLFGLFIGNYLGKIRITKEHILIIVLTISIAVFLPYQIASGRYTVSYMIFVFDLAALGLVFLAKNKYINLIIGLYFCLLAVYYFLNTMPILPYGLGWANKESYLRRELIKDYISYYDYNGKFSEKIKPDKTIITYGLSELYYADFMYKNAYYFIDQNKLTISIPAIYNKILIRGGDFEWFCSRTMLKNCSEYKVTLLTSDSQAKQYLYKIKSK